MTIDDQLSIGFVCQWTRDRTKTWSHTPLSLQDALQRRNDVRIHDKPMHINEIKRHMYRLLGARWHDGRFVSTWRFSRGIRKLEAAEISRVIGSGKGLDAVLSMFEYGPVPLPQFIYQDYSFSHMLLDYSRNGRFFALFEMYPIRMIEEAAEMQQKTFDAASGILTLSEWDRQALVRQKLIPPEKIISVGAGIHVPVEPPSQKRFEPADPGRKRKIVFIGRLFFIKNGDLVVDAVESLVRDATYPIELVIAGPTKWPLKYEIPTWVNFLGDASHQQLRSELVDADVLVLPSRFEAFGIAAIEALAAGVPVVGRNDFAMPEFIIPGINGDLINSDDAIELATALDRVINSTEIRIETARRASSVADYYNWDRVASDTVTFIKTRLQSSSH